MIEARIGDLVTVVPRPTVVRMDDLHGERREWIVEGYHLTPEVGRFLDSLTAWLGRERGGGGFLVGPYGSGKSHFLAYVAAGLEDGRLLPGDAPAVVTLSLLNHRGRRSLEDVVLEALGLDDLGGDRRRTWEALTERYPRGVLLLIDELSEFLRSKPDSAAFNEDVRFLQFLGEWARDGRLWVLAALQEEVEHTGRVESVVHRKIKDRYPLRLVLPPSHVRNLVAEHLLVRRKGFEEAMAALLDDVETALPPGSLEPESVRRLYPVHPVTLELMEEVRDIFSQTRGAVDLVVSRLLGDPSRGIEPFLERPWGEFLTPDVIVDHFEDLFGLQPELLPLAERLFPHYRQAVPELFDTLRQQELAWRLLKLLVLVHISPRRKGLTAEDAVAWLALRATTAAPERNVSIAGRVLERLAGRGAFVVEEAGRYRLDLDDEGSRALERLLPREVAEVERMTPAAVWEQLSGLMDGLPFDPLALPRDRWRVHAVRWHLHERQVAFTLGEGVRERPPVPLAVRILEPWNGTGPAAGTATLIPEPVELDRDLIELAAMLRLRARTGPAGLSKALERRIAKLRPRLVSAVQGTYLGAVLVDGEGRRHTPPRPAVREPLERWLDGLALWMLRRRYPAFERIAPAAGPLPKAAYRRFVEFVEERGLDAETDDDLVTAIRDGYLVPMGLMRREGWYTVLADRLDRNELVRNVLTLLESRPSPRIVVEHLRESVFGLVPDQAELLLLLLHLVGEIEIRKGRRSYGELYHTLPLPSAYDTIGPADVLPAGHLAALEALCSALGVRRPRRWSATALGAVLERLRARSREDRDTLQRFSRKLDPGEDGGVLRNRIEEHLSVWSVLDSGDSPVATLERFLAGAGDVGRLVAEREALLQLPGRLEALLERRTVLARLLAHPHLAVPWDEELAGTLREVGKPPPPDRPEALEEWIGRAETAYDAYAAAYRERHDAYWHDLVEHPVWTWTPPSIARSRHAGLGPVLETLERSRARARELRCTGLVDPALGPRCACGFDGLESPIEESLARFTEARKTIERTLEGFFATEKVREAVRSWTRDGLEISGETVAYLEGRSRLPEIRDVALFDRHLDGAGLVVEVTPLALLGGLLGRVVTPEEAAGHLRARLESIGGERIRIVGEARDDAGNETLARWCLARSLETGAVLPAVLHGRLPEEAARWIEPGQVAPAALGRLTMLGLGRPVEDRIIRWVADADLAVPAGTDPDPLVAAARELVRPDDALSPADRGPLAASLYAVDGRLRPVLGDRWANRLREVAEAPFDPTPPPLLDVLRDAAASQWLLVDCLGLPLLGALRPVLAAALARWKVADEGFATVGRRTTTAACWDALAEDGIDHPILKIDAVDRLLHERRLAFGELERLAATELAVALERLVPTLDPDLPVLVFADHGFRLAPDGRTFVHGGPSPLERTVPVMRFVPGNGSR